MNVVAQTKRPERRFPRYKLPLEANILGKTVTVCDWSQAGLGLSGIKDMVSAGEIHPITVFLKTDGSTLSLDLKARIVWTNREEKRAGLEILDPEEKTRPLADFADLYLAGRLVEDEDKKIHILGNDMSQEEKTSPPVTTPYEPESANVFGRVFGLLVFAFVGFIAFWFLFDVVYKRLFTFDAISASVTAQVVTVYHPRDGIIEYTPTDGTVARGDRLAVVRLDTPDLNGNRTLDILSPCDCTVISQNRPSLTFARAGTEVLTLVSDATKPHISLRVPFRRLSVISKEPRISLTYLDGQSVEDVKILSVPKVTEFTATQLEILVEPGRELDPSMIGQPVYAVFDTAPIDIGFVSLNEIYDGISASWSN